MLFCQARANIESASSFSSLRSPPITIMSETRYVLQNSGAVNNNETTPPLPQAGISYPIRLGASITAPESVTNYLFRYQLKPANADDNHDGVVEIDEDKVEVQLATRDQADQPITFLGTQSSLRQGDCVLIFEGDGYRLEQTAYAMNLKHSRHIPERKQQPLVLAGSVKRDIKNSKDSSNNNKNKNSSILNTLAQVKRRKTTA